MFKKANFWLTFIGTLTSVISVIYFFFPLDNSIILDVKTVSLENLTIKDSKQEPELNIIYEFKGDSIDNLWKYTIRFTNNSDKTLIGIGTQKNIITENLALELKNEYTVIDKKLIKSDFANSILITDSTKISLAFQQWRKNEFCEYSFYIVTRQKKPSEFPFREPEFRQIIDGNIIFTNDNYTKNRRITEYTPIQVRKIWYVLSLILLGIFALTCLYSFIVWPISYYRHSTWAKNNKIAFFDFVKSKFPSNEKKIRSIINDPNTLPESMWNEYSGDVYPEIYVDFLISKFYQVLLMELTLFILITSFIATFIDLIYFFP